MTAMPGRLPPALALLAGFALLPACAGAPAPAAPAQPWNSIFASFDAPADAEFAPPWRPAPTFAPFLWSGLSGSPDPYFDDVAIRGRGLSSVDPSVEAAARASRLRILLYADYGSGENQGIYARFSTP